MAPYVVGVIPARAGSKGIPHKNLVRIGGQPLIAFTCEAARRSRTLSRVILSTDSPDIVELAGRHGIEAPFLRPAELARDDSGMLPVLQHAVRFLEQQDGRRPDVVVLLQPTSPLRTTEHIDEAVRLLLESGADSVVSVVEVPHQFSPLSVLRVADGRLVPFAGDATVTRRQDKPVLYARNGPAVLAVRSSVLLEQNSLYGSDSRPFVMGPEESVDVDGSWDLDLVEMILARRA
jgi:CMP-N-acetylneuraminic acid synthetase